MAGRGQTQRLCASNFTLFLERVSSQRSSRKLRLPVHEGMIPQFHFWGIYPIELKQILNICTLRCIAALFTIAKSGNNP